MSLPDTEDIDTAPFWAAAREQRLVAQRCDACGALRCPPHPFCAACRSPAASWVDLSGRGRIWSYIVAHGPTLAAFMDRVPFPVIVVELDENPALRMTGNLIAHPGAAINSVAPESIRIGAPVRVSFEKVADDVTLPCWIVESA